MSARKNKPLTIEAIQGALLPSIANLFETQTAQIRSEMAEKFKTQKIEILSEIREEMAKKFKTQKTEIIHEVKILMENDKRIETAMDLLRSARNTEITIQNHDQRLDKLETEVTVIKTVLKSTNS
jgi:putative heme iron utilization protein